MAVVIKVILGVAVGCALIALRKYRRKKRVEALVREVVLAHLSGDTARMDQASAGLKSLGITLVGIEEISRDE